MNAVANKSFRKNIADCSIVTVAALADKNLQVGITELNLRSAKLIGDGQVISTKRFANRAAKAGWTPAVIEMALEFAAADEYTVELDNGYLQVIG